mmetsp:Transcript_138893/g.443471  ORF Transcript_138893/g.443471 Transcript_138893/m.443471 type:complete len:357 (-) Transcript_138893:75-1145(-)
MGQLQGRCIHGFAATDSEIVRVDSLIDYGMEQVRLNVYDVAVDARVELVNGLFGPAGAGVYHAGVEVYGHEWSFGCRMDGGSGVFSCEPRLNDNVGKFREEILLGGTKLSQVEVLGCIAALEQDWIGEDYDLMSRNCCHFCSHLLLLLGTRPMPRWITSLAGTGEALRSSAQAVQKAALTSAPCLMGGVQAGLEAVQSLLTAVDVVLECVRTPAGGAAGPASMQRWERCIAVRVAPGRPQRIGPKYQSEAFERLLGENTSEALEAMLKHGYFFQLEWEPPCLFLRKPASDCALMVGGSWVRQPTYVLLNSSEISLSGSQGGEVQLSFKVDKNTSALGLKMDRTLSSLHSARASSDA